MALRKAGITFGSHAAAAALFLGAAATLCWPMLGGKLLLGPYSDYYEAGYAYREFATQFWRLHHAIPLWNPHLLGGIPYVAGMHGDIFYPTAVLRWLTSTGTALDLAFFLHLALAGVFTYAFALALEATWVGALVAGLSYELTGIVASLVHPGHDGKLFVSAIAPLLFLGILRAVRDRRASGLGVIALATGLALHGHPQLSYYLMVAGLIWGLFLLFIHEGRPRRNDGIKIAFGCALAVALGFGLYAIQALPFMEYIPFSPRGAGGPSTGWEYATAYSLPIEELMTTVLPQFNGVIEHYWGRNPIKLHTEYLGVLVTVLALLGLGGRTRRSATWGLGAIAGLFLLIALGSHTPFYRLWYEVMPMVKKVRAPGMAFFLVAFPVSIFAGFGADRWLGESGSGRRLWIGLGVLGGIGLLGVMGVLQSVAEALAIPERFQYVAANAVELRLGSMRLLAAVAAAGGCLHGIRRGWLKGFAAPLALAVVLVADAWSVDRKFFVFSPTASETFREDDVIRRLGATPLPYRVWDPQGRYEALAAYPKSWLMIYGIPQLLGYHGQELKYFDELLGGKNDWPQQVNPSVWRLFAVRYLVLRRPQDVPGFHQVLGPVRTAPGDSAFLYQADTLPVYARVMTGAAKIPEAQVPSTVVDPRFPAERIALYPDTAGLSPDSLGGQVPPPSNVAATVAEWEPGRMRITLVGQDPKSGYLVVSENWYKDWHATVDGTPAPVHRADHTLLSVILPPGAKEVVFQFRSPAYQRGRAISLASAAGVLALLLIPAVRRRQQADG